MFSFCLKTVFLLLLTGRYPLVKGTPKNFSAEKFFEASPLTTGLRQCLAFALYGGVLAAL